MKKIAALLLIIAATLPAGDSFNPFYDEEPPKVEVEVFALGLSYHTNRSVDWNEINPGLGVGLARYHGGGLYTTVTVGTYKDSFNDRAKFALAGVRKMLGDSEGLHATASFSFGYFDGSGFNGIGYMPVVSVGYDWFDICLTGNPFWGNDGNNESRDTDKNRKTETSFVAVFAKIRLATF